MLSAVSRLLLKSSGHAGGSGQGDGGSETGFRGCRRAVKSECRARADPIPVEPSADRGSSPKK